MTARRKRFKLPVITPKELKEVVEWLWENKCGCYHKCLWVDEGGREWDIVVGWHDRGRNSYDVWDDELYYVDNEGDDQSWYITAGVLYQDPHNGMTTDMDIDFLMPVCNEYGDLYDMRFGISRKENWRSQAAKLNRDAREMWSWWKKELKEARKELATE